MALSSLSCLALVLATSFIGLTQLPTPASANYPGVIELVGYSNRRARTHYIPPPDNPTLAPPPDKTQADIETVKANIEKYNKLLTLDTKNLPESQKDMLERIVERVARLKESLDIEDNANIHANIHANAATQKSSEGSAASAVVSTIGTTEASTLPEAETDPTLVLDETTLLQLQTSMDELAAAQAAVTAQTNSQSRDLPTTTEFNPGQTDAIGETTESMEDSTAAATAGDFVSTTLDPLTDATDADDQFVAARSNNNIAAITAAEPDPSSTLSTTVGNQRTITTSGKLTKTRATKRPLSGYTKAAGASAKRGQRPSAAATAALHKQTTSKQKLATGATTTQPLPYHQQQLQPKQPQLQYQKPQQPASPYQQHKVSPIAVSVTADKATSVAPTTAPRYGGNTNANDMAYDAHVNTSAIIDSLNHAREEFYQQKQTVNNKDKKPSATAKPTKYHYYPHNQHIYLLPECAIQQVCNAVYVRLNYTQPLCACPSRYRDPCSASLNEDDQHTTKLVGDGKKKAITLAKTCEATTEMRECRSPKDWSLLALQNTRTGKSHYLVICRCPDHFKMEGPMAHDQPTYASVPGIRVFGMMCVKPGYSVRKPSVQPPKRYQLQKPFYRPSSQSSYINGAQYGGTKDNYGRPAYGGGASSTSSSSSSNYHADDVYQGQHQANYQYLNRPESTHSALSTGNYRPETLTSINNFQNGIYGRNNERKGDSPIEAVKDDENKSQLSTSTQSSETVGTTLSELASSGSDASSANNAAEATSAQQSEESTKREKRSLVEDGGEWEDDTPEFPWDRVLEFQQSIVWD